MKLLLYNNSPHQILFILQDPSDARTPQLKDHNASSIDPLQKKEVELDSSTVNIFLWKIESEPILFWKGIVPVGIKLEIDSVKNTVSHNGNPLPSSFAPVTTPDHYGLSYNKKDSFQNWGHKWGFFIFCSFILIIIIFIICYCYLNSPLI